MRRRLLVSIVTLPFLILAGLAIAGAASAGGGCHGGTGVPSTAVGSVVKIDGCTFLPTVTITPVGSEVRFINGGPQVHDITGRPEDRWKSPVLEAGENWSWRFVKAGVYPYS